MSLKDVKEGDLLPEEDVRALDSISHAVKEAGGWSFRDIARDFDSHVRQSVPFYDEAHHLLGKLSTFFVEDSTQVYDIGTSTGQAIISISEANPDKELNYIAIDTQIAMLDEAKKRFIQHEIEDYEMNGMSALNVRYENASLITAMLSLQFISPRKRLELMYKIYDGLNVGGAFIMFEKFQHEFSQFDNINTQLYHDFKEETLDAKHILDKQRSLRGVMKLHSPTERNMLLEKAGFHEINITEIFRWNNFALVLAVK